MKKKKNPLMSGQKKKIRRLRRQSFPPKSQIGERRVRKLWRGLEGGGGGGRGGGSGIRTGRPPCSAADPSRGWNRGRGGRMEAGVGKGQSLMIRKTSPVLKGPPGWHVDRNQSSCVRVEKIRSFQTYFFLISRRKKNLFPRRAAHACCKNQFQPVGHPSAIVPLFGYLAGNSPA